MDKTIRPHNCRVSICNNNNTIQLRFTHGKKRQNLNLGLPYIPENLAIASQKAYEIDRDIKSGIFKGKEHYKIFPSVSVPSVSNSHDNDEWDLLDILNFYDQMKSLDPEVQKLVNELRDWLERSPREIITLDKADQWLSYLRNEIPHKNSDSKGYSERNIATKWRILKASVNFAIALNKIKSNNTLVPLYKTLSKKQKEIRSYTPEQINEIITAFRDNHYTHKFSQTKDSFYADFIEFRFLTGCRPSEAIALTPSDIISRNNRTFVLFNKRYVNGHLKEGLKNGKPYRLFPVNEKLQTLLDKLPKHHKLLFTNPSGSYIDTSKVGSRFWNKIVRNLVAEGKLPFHIPFYDERHCFGSIVARQTTDIKTLATIMGNSPQTLYKNYLADDLDFDVPIF